MDMRIALDFLLSSSSDDDDEVDEFFLISRIIARKKTRLKIQDHINVVHNYTDEKFKQTFRISRRLCHQLIDLFADSKFYPRIFYGDTVKRAETHILAFIWYAANKSTLRSVSERFNTTESTLFNMNNRVIDFLLDQAPLVIRFPYTEEKRERNAADFAHVTRIPGVIGCLDGTYINCRTPANKISSTYINRHDQKSLTLQGICDKQRGFIDCFIGPLSKCHDSRIFNLSFVYPLIHSLAEEYHILGDAAYGASVNVLTPYKNFRGFTQRQQNFNYQLSKGRVKIENCFGLLKNRLRHLLRTDFKTVEKTANIVVCCCILHNLCIDDNGLFFNDDEIEEIRNFHEQLYNNNNLLNNYDARVNRIQGIVKRNRITNAL